MTWLSEIEDKNETNKIFVAERSTTPAISENIARKALVDIDRMARVIRELGAYIKASHAEENAHLGIAPPPDFDKIVKEREDAWDNMSSDAKELLA